MSLNKELVQIMESVARGAGFNSCTLSKQQIAKQRDQSHLPEVPWCLFDREVLLHRVDELFQCLSKRLVDRYCGLTQDISYFKMYTFRGATVVILCDSNADVVGLGVAACSPRDRLNYNIGFRIAAARALASYQPHEESTNEVA